jgi:hypothetical protein
MGFPTEGYDKLSYIRNVTEIDCKTKSSRVLFINYLDVDRNVL